MLPRTPAALIANTLLLAATTASATGILLPLYIYPSAVYNDGAANWAPAISAISSDTGVSWLVVVNVDSGPGGSGQPGDDDVNYIYGTNELNSYPNVHTIGYVRTDYGASPMAQLQSNVTEWAGWASYAQSNIAVKGIFFDEAGTDQFDYLSSAISYAKSAFGNADDFVSVCNFGTTAAEEFYTICDVVIAYEDTLANYKGQATIDNNIPAGYADQAAIIVNAFDGSADTLASDVQTLKDDGIAWAYFCSTYDSITTSPATVGQLAADFA